LHWYWLIGCKGNCPHPKVREKAYLDFHNLAEESSPLTEPNCSERTMQNVISERRRAPRENVSESVLICPCDSEYPEEVCTTLNVSQSGLYFATGRDHYYPGMNVIVTFDSRSDNLMPQEYIGDIVRLDRLGESKWGVAIRILMPYTS
jgi:PilZ domain-containing protein